MANPALPASSKPARLPAGPISVPGPYKFLDYFTASEAGRFYGRQDEIHHLLEAVRENQVNTLCGPSGAGKTSLFRAGVEPALRSEGYQVVYIRSFENPVNAVKAALKDLVSSQLPSLDVQRPLRLVLTEALPVIERLALVMDSFEDFFIFHNEGARQIIAEEIFTPLQQDKELRLVFILRDDFVQHLFELEAYFPKGALNCTFHLAHLEREQAVQAIIQPAQSEGFPVEDALIQHLLDDLETEGIPAPRLQVTLYRLYRDMMIHRPPTARAPGLRGLTLKRYLSIGGAAGIWKSFLDDILDALPGPVMQGFARQLFKWMIGPLETGVPLSRFEIDRINRTARFPLTPVQVDMVLNHLRQNGVLRRLAYNETYELAHEILASIIWGWLSQIEIHYLKQRDDLRGEVSSSIQTGQPLPRTNLENIQENRQHLVLRPVELEVISRSALTNGFETGYWLQRLKEEGLSADELVSENLHDPDYRIRLSILTALSHLDSHFTPQITAMLSDVYPQVRMVAIRVLERLQPGGTWRSHLTHECYVPAGDFRMGDREGVFLDEGPSHNVHLEGYYIQKFPVTNKDFKRYMDDLGQVFTIPHEKEDHPVVGITWFQALEYARWAMMRLPSETEWEKAASWDARAEAGRKKRKYPWGNSPETHRFNCRPSQIGETTPVSAYSPIGDSAYGCADMAGNVWEWTISLHIDYPYRSDDGREDPAALKPRVLRGGSFLEGPSYARTTHRRQSLPYNTAVNVGFRCAISIRELPDISSEEEVQRRLLTVGERAIQVVDMHTELSTG